MQKESVAAQVVFLHTPGCDQAIYWLRRISIWLFLTYQHYWNSPTVQELESKPQIRPLDARWHFANLITWGEGKKITFRFQSCQKQQCLPAWESAGETESYSLFSSLEHNKCVCCMQATGGRWPPLLRCRKKRHGKKRRERVYHTEHCLSCSQPRDLCFSTAAPRAPNPPESYPGSWKDHRGNIFSVDLQLKWQLKNNCALEIGTVSAQVNWTLYNQPLRHGLISTDGTERKMIWYQSWIPTCSYWTSFIYKWRNNRNQNLQDCLCDTFVWASECLCSSVAVRPAEGVIVNNPLKIAPLIFL